MQPTLKASQPGEGRVLNLAPYIQNLRHTKPDKAYGPYKHCTYIYVSETLNPKNTVNPIKPRTPINLVSSINSVNAAVPARPALQTL